MNVAVLGMGRMGRAIAGRLVEDGHRVTVWNRSPGRAAEIVSAGGREADDVAEAVEGVEVAITMLANDAACEDCRLRGAAVLDRRRDGLHGLLDGLAHAERRAGR